MNRLPTVHFVTLLLSSFVAAFSLPAADPEGFDPVLEAALEAAGEEKATPVDMAENGMASRRGTVEYETGAQAALRVLNEGNAVIAVGKEASPALRALAKSLAARSGQSGPVDATLFVTADPHRAQRRWGLRGWVAGKTLVALGTAADNSLVREPFFRDNRCRPNPLWPGDMPDGEIRVTHPHALPMKPWLGRPFVWIGGHDEALVRVAGASLLTLLPVTPPEPDALMAWFVGIEETTLPEETNCDPARQEAFLSGARNEWRWLKLVVRPAASVVRLTLRVTADDKTAPWSLYRLLRRGPGDTGLDDVLWPSEVVPGAPMTVTNLPANRTTLFVLEQRIATDAPDGKQTFRVHLETDDHVRSLSFGLEVFDFAIPERMPVPVHFYGSTHDYSLRRFFGADNDEQYDRALRSMARQFGKFGATVMPSLDYVGMVRWIMGRDGQFHFDYEPMERFIRAMESEGVGGPYIVSVRLDRPRRTVLGGAWGRSEVYDADGTHYELRAVRGAEGEIMGRAGAWQHWRRKISDLQNDPRPWLRDLRDHMERQGRLEETYIYYGDEPDDTAEWMARQKPVLETGLKPFSSFNRTTPDDLSPLLGKIDPLVLLYLRGHHNRWQELAVKRRALGERVWWYHCLGLVAAHNTFAAARSFAWESWRFGVDGIGFWSPFSPYTVAYRANNNPEASVVPIEAIPWHQFVNLAMAFYNDLETHALLGSRRLAVVATGWSDYRYLWKLARLTAMHPEGSPARQVGEAALERAYRLAVGDSARGPAWEHPGDGGLRALYPSSDHAFGSYGLRYTIGDGERDFAAARRLLAQAIVTLQDEAL